MDTLARSVPFISPEELRLRIGTPDAPLLLDVRRRATFAESAHMLAGAQRCAPEDLPAFAISRPPQEVVVYCVYGHNVSEDAAALLRAAGWNARLLAGGMQGGEAGVDAALQIGVWRATPVPTLRKRPDLGMTGEAPSRWITRERPKIDRVACPWLVRRFIDRTAEFFYVPSGQVLARAQDTGAVAFDIPGAPISHNGELCSFDALLVAFALEDAALNLLAPIVRGADTDRLDLAPESAGLLAFSLGLSSLHATDDQAMLEAAMPLYDALYASCRQKVLGQAETHTWKPASAPGASA